MNDEIRKRDILWCTALVSTLDIKDVARVLADFNSIRPDGDAVEHTLAHEQGLEFCPGHAAPVVNGCCFDCGLLRRPAGKA